MLVTSILDMSIVLEYRDDLVVKAEITRLSCHEFESSVAEDPPCRGSRCTPRRSPEVRRGVQLRRSPHHLTMAQDNVDRRQLPSSSPHSHENLQEAS
ncbi:hypothetical protein TNCV_3939471 [Trichonephila clavipes]|uniref:Uncharacterized protein n=1 Tax=Trichonephila clavipes TaxID=2585209 RepID=A0A8X7B8D7_TRICX|nr:hypothetical protein TNCV_3939471 [Trichonephila clavipes]